MSKSAAKPAAPSAAKQGPSRKRRNSFMRKCLSKSSKRLFGGMGHVVFRMLESVERTKKTGASA